jgi:DNA-binding NtrC family response regulator
LRPLEAEVRAGRFRADLFYRIQGITLDVPPLRERRADIAPLVRQFVAQISAKHGTAPPRLTREALAALSSYAWPGNVRELRNVLEHVVLLREGKRVRARDLPFAAATAAPDAPNPDRDRPAGETLEVRLDRPLEETVTEVLRAALALEGGNRAAAARRLGVSLRTVQRHIARSPDAFDA